MSFQFILDKQEAITKVMLDIEKNLKEDPSGEYKKELLSKFSDLEMEVRTELNKGIAPVEYERLNKLLQAVEASTSVLEQY